LRRSTATVSAARASIAPLFRYFIREAKSDIRFDELLDRADVVIITSTGCGDRAGIDPQLRIEVSPRSVVVTVSDFGWTGRASTAATEFTLQGRVG